MLTYARRSAVLILTWSSAYQLARLRACGCTVSVPCSVKLLCWVVHVASGRKGFTSSGCPAAGKWSGAPSSSRDEPFPLRRFVLGWRLAMSREAGHPQGRRVTTALGIPNDSRKRKRVRHGLIYISQLSARCDLLPGVAMDIRLPFSGTVHHLSGPNTYALTQTTLKITVGCTCTYPSNHFHCDLLRAGRELERLDDCRPFLEGSDVFEHC